ncbi:response regulator consisting of a CheY-like receiver domain and a winged-helix DNA-binding domain [Microbacterium testaceum StLB037]|uniref:Response regulator consisting of a CheY-like receiver domain and a winged-helix DNA-binding domain n=2 Tax=Microbacterium testaceum TaxID=2033 RepID=E8NEI4_MICTS|nr:response regulator transcription factor [Microbacterium testaceum]BAJ73850.1 response regulator consisting of a CheY-like receiver domain and a winged-helix DNA-binding domain [Microbacterium testaceum StLB037]
MSDSTEMLKTAVIVEDDPDIRHLLVEVLEAAGFSTVSVGNGIDGVRAVIAYQPLITTLDVNMPGIDGFEAARRIRQQSDTYIIMLTGLEEEADVVLGLGAGADEYVVKPFRPRELRARIEALLRRPRSGSGASAAAPRQDSVGPSFPAARPADPQAPAAAAPPTAPPPSASSVPVVVPSSQGPEPRESVGSELAPRPSSDAVVRSPGAVTPTGGPWIVHRDLHLDPDSRIVLVGGEELELTRTEFDLLATLMESKRRVRSKADLTLVLRGESYVTSYFVGEADKRAIEAHMTNLRRKLGDNPANPRYIETVRGVGYRLTSELMAAP